MSSVSIIICCYNSEERIQATLEHILKQRLPEEIELEVILVDNNSQDLTKKIALDFWLKSKSVMKFSIVDEPHPGLSYARKRGVNVAIGDYLIFCDDDNWLDEVYVANAVEIMGSNTKIGVLGGIGSPVVDGKKPFWFNRYKKYYAVGPQGEMDGDVTLTKGYVYGAGSVINKTALDLLFNCNFKNLLADRTANLLISGGDNELCYNIAFLGYEIHYSSKLRFQHYIPTRRLTLEYLKKFRIGQAYSYDIIKSYETILFSRGLKRRTNKERLKEYKKIGKDIFLLWNKKKKGTVDEARYIFVYFNSINILSLGIFKWRYHQQKEKEIYESYKQLKKVNI